MQKRLRESAGSAKGRIREKPLAEGIVGLNCRGERDWASMSDEEMASFAESLVASKDLRNRNALKKTDQSLYRVLLKRGLLDSLPFSIRQERREPRDWKGMSDEELVGFADAFIKERGIASRKKLNTEDQGIYYALIRRGLLDKVALPKRREKRDWRSMSDAGLLRHSASLIERTGIRKISQLIRSDPSLYSSLKRRRLLDKTGLEWHSGGWGNLTDAELISATQKLIAEVGITTRTGLRKAASGLCKALDRRGLGDRIGLERTSRDWRGWSDDDIVSHVGAFMKERGIRSRKEIVSADQGLYHIILKRKLMGRLDFETVRTEARDWDGMGREGLMLHARGFLMSEGITARNNLRDADQPLYEALRRRGMLDELFLEIESRRDKDGVREVVDALEEFG